MEQFEYIKQFINNSYSQFFAQFQNINNSQYETVDTDIIMKHIEKNIESEDYQKLLQELINKVLINSTGEELMNSATKNNLIMDIPI